MEKITLNNEKYYSGVSLQKLAPIYFKGCRNVRELITKKDLNKKDYTFARLTNEKWSVTDGKSKQLDTVLFSEAWADKNIPELAKSDKVKYDIAKAPEIIVLDDAEKMKDDSDNILEIEVRGEREFDKCYFKVKDVGKCFKINKLENTIQDKKSSYTEENEYDFFNCVSEAKNLKKANVKDVKKEMFLSYSGLLRVLFVSHSKIAKKFINWASKTLFTVQMGTVKQKTKLVSDIMGVHPEAVKEVFSKTSNTMPCIYLFSLGTVKDLRATFKIDKKYDDDSIIYKYGLTEDLSRRTGEHIITYKKYKGTDLKLKMYNYVDPQYVYNAETDLKNVIKRFKCDFKFEAMNELTILNKADLKLIEKQFEQISKSYIGHISELVSKIKDLESQLREEKLRNELKEKELERLLSEEKLKNRIRELENDAARIKIKMKK